MDALLGMVRLLQAMHLRARRNKRGIVFVCALSVIAIGAACEGDPAAPLPRDFVAVGTWGGKNAGMLAEDTVAHVHIGCTYGDIHGRVPLDSGRFDITGSYLLRAYPIAMGPTMPARFTGHVLGRSLIFTVTVTDTVEHTTTTLGPVSVTFGKEPQMGPCPICATPGGRAAAGMLTPAR